MKRYLFLISLVFYVLFFSNDKSHQIISNSNVLDLKVEAQNAFNYLNLIRQNPSAYSSEIGIDLNYVSSKHKLVWNSSLQKTAEKKAQDMANRNYFEHVDPEGYGMNYFINKNGYTLTKEFLENKRVNSFESIAYGRGIGNELIKLLMIDKGYEHKPGHRNHLLGITDFWSNCSDIGIGIAYNPNSKYKYYACFLIAKHDF